MKILHTADIHLREFNDERWSALCRLVDIGKKQKVDIFVISGDLFDKDVDAEKLRAKISTLFSGNCFKVIIVPGNHDKESYKSGLYFGSDTKILNDFGKFYENKELRIIAVPFEELPDTEVFEKIQTLKSNLSKRKENIVVCHGELLDVFYSQRDFGDEGMGRYMPFKLSYFSGLDIKYVLAGHFHTRFDVWILDNGGYFVYPGSPVSITKRETMQRKANIFELGKEPKEFLLDTPYFDEVSIELDPFGRKKSLDIIKKRIETIPPNAKPLITIQGFFNGSKEKIDEEKLIKAIEKIAPKNSELNPPEIRDVRTILEDDLFIGFQKKVDELDMEEDEKNRMIDIAIEAMTEAKRS